jgi:hypothetical protein
MVARNPHLARPTPTSLADTIETILDKGLVLDVYVRVSLLGVELLTVDARIVVASVDTYLRFAESVRRLDLTETETQGIAGLIEETYHAGAKGAVEGVIETTADTVRQLFPKTSG